MARSAGTHWARILISLLLLPLPATAQRTMFAALLPKGVSKNAAACDSTTIQNLANTLTDGDSILLPTCNSATITSRVEFTHAISLFGAGQSLTTLHGALSGDMLRWSQTVNTPVRISGFSAVYDSGTGRVIRYDGDGVHCTNGLRIDHLTGTNLPDRFMAITELSNQTCQVSGLIDHITFTTNQAHPTIRHYGSNDSWFSDPPLGSQAMLYIEDSSFTWSASTIQAALDVEHGGMIVFRHNTVSSGGVLYHDTGSTAQARATRWAEVYANTFTCTDGSMSGNCFDAISARGGSAVVYDNSVALDAAGNAGWERVLFSQIYRENPLQAGGAPMDYSCGAATHAVCSSFRGWCTANGVATNTACGFNSDCTGAAPLVCNFTAPPNSAACGGSYVSVSNIDGAGTAPQLGYPCRDQTGAGKDDPTTHAQIGAANPEYVWNNTDSRNSNALITGTNAFDNGNNSNHIVSNRDYYTQVASFTGASGVGRGTLASRPATCTTGVGYWETDNSKFDTCVSTNTWGTYYTPLVYPHPLNH